MSSGSPPPDPMNQRELVERILAEREEIEAPCDPRQYRVLARLVENPTNRFVLGLGGGSVPGLTGNIALVRIVDELGLRSRVAEVWGTSAGAVIGGTWASGTSPDALLALLDDLARKNAVDFDRWEVLVKGVVRMIFRRTLPDGLVRGRHFRDAIRSALPFATFEECPIPFRCIACTDDGTARKVVFRRGPLLEAIVASMCIPGVAFPTPDWNGESHGYLDGGVVEKTPLVSIVEDHHRAARSDRLLVLCTHFGQEIRVTPRGFLQRFLSTMHHLEDELWRGQVEAMRAVADLKFVVLSPRLELGGMFDFALARPSYLQARKRFKEQLSNARLGLRFAAH